MGCALFFVHIRKPESRLGGTSEYILDTSLEQEEILVVKRVAVVAHPYVTAVELHTEIFIQIPVYAKRQVFFLTTIDFHSCHR